jgi:hypothetical protein
MRVKVDDSHQVERCNLQYSSLFKECCGIRLNAIIVIHSSIKSIFKTMIINGIRGMRMYVRQICCLLSSRFISCRFKTGSCSLVVSSTLVSSRLV